MSGAAVFIIAFFTSIITAVGSVYLVERLHIFEPPSTSAEPQTAVVPSFAGQPLSEAQVAAKALGFELFVAGVEEKADSAPNAVLRQSVSPGRVLATGTSISVVVSAALVETPDVVGQDRDAAATKLKAAGLLAEIGEPVPHGELPPGSVVSQTPEAGVRVAPETRVSLRLSSGPAEIEVPKVTGFSLSLAKKKLQEVGLKHAVRWVDLAETATYVVLRQEPAAGDKVEPDGTVTLIVNRE